MAANDWLLGLDLGGGSARALLVNAASGIQHARARPWPAPLGPELELEAAFAALASASRAALAACGPGARVVGIAATALRFGSALLARDGRALVGATNRDARGLVASFALASSQGAALHARTGHWPIPVLPLARFAALHENAPALWADVAHVLSLSDWLAFRLCGELASDFSQAGASGLFDLATGSWADDLAQQVGLAAAQLPRLRAAGERLGTLGANAAEALGLAAGIPVAVGGADTQCALLGLGVTEAGETGAVCGTTLPLQRVVAVGCADPDGRVWRAPHVVSGVWVAECNAGPAGEALEWLGRALFPEGPSGAARALAEAADAEPGAAGMLSTFGAQVADARALALPLGDLTLTHLLGAPERGRARLLRAVAEGIAYAVRANLETLDALAAAPPTAPLAISGGLSRSRLFAQTLADVTGRPIRRGAADASALGAAICAGVGAGLFADLRTGARALASREEFAPHAERSSAYAARYGRWRELRAKRAPGDAVAQGHAIQGMLGAIAASAGAVAKPLARPRILITAELDETALAAFRALGDVEYASYRARGRLLSGDALIEALRGFEAFVTEIDLVDSRALLALPELRVVASCRGDAVNVDVAAASALGVPVLHAPGRNAEAVADLTLAFLLALARKLPAASAFLRDPALEAGDLGAMGRAHGQLRGRELWGKTVGIVGLGAVGRKVAQRLAPFGVRLLAADPFVTPEAALRAGAELAPLARVLAESDFVTLHAAVRGATRGLIGAPQLAQMKPGASLVNTARAALVDEDALAEALESGRLAGAALDVFSVEPPGAAHPLMAAPNLIATPHVGGNTFEVAIHQGQIVSDDFARLVGGERPRHLADPSAWANVNLAAPRAAPSDALRAELLAHPAPAVTDLQRDKKPAPAAAKLAPRAMTAPQAGANLELALRFRGVLERFCAAASSDAALRAAAAGKSVALQFLLPDAALVFHLALRDERASAALGEAAPPAEVNLRMRAAILDGMLSGRVNAMQEAMSGGIAFSGDAGKAMTLQQIQPELQRLWNAARESAGDLSELATLGGGTEPTRVAAPPDDVRVQVVAVVEELYRQSLITATGGNVSARVPSSQDLWITPSALFKGDLRPEAMVRIGVDGGLRETSGPSASSERLMHCAVYAARPEAQAVIHVHAPNATILANAGLPFLPVSTEAAFFGELPRIAFIMPGTEALAAAVREAMRASWAVLLVNHGLLVAGRSLRRAADMAEIIERSAQLILGCYALGKPPPVLPPDAVAELRKLGDLVA